MLGGRFSFSFVFWQNDSQEPNETRNPGVVLAFFCGIVEKHFPPARLNRVHIGDGVRTPLAVGAHEVILEIQGLKVSTASCQSDPTCRRDAIQHRGGREQTHNSCKTAGGELKGC